MKEYLTQLSTAELLDKIKSTRGYILYQMDKYKVPAPDINIFLEDINPYTLNYVLKNYELTDAQVNLLRPYFSDYKENAISSKMLSDADIIEYLQSGKELPRNTVLPLYILHDYKDSILKSKLSLDNSISNLKLEEILSIDYDVLALDADSLNRKPEYFADKRYRNLYVKLVKQKARKDRRYMSFHHFRHFQFTDKDSALVQKLLDNIDSDSSYAPKYTEIAKIPGFTQHCTPEKYFKYNYRDVECMTDYTGVLDVWAKNHHYINDLVRYNVSAAQLKEILNVDYFVSCYKSYVSHNDIESSHTSDLRRNIEIFNNVYIDFFMQHPEHLEDISYFYNILDKNTHPNLSDFKRQLINLYTSSEHFDEHVVRLVGHKFFLEECLANPSINKILCLKIFDDDLLEDALYAQLDPAHLKKLGIDTNKHSSKISTKDNIFTDSILGEAALLLRIEHDPEFINTIDYELSWKALNLIIDMDQKDFIKNYKFELPDIVQSNILSKNWDLLPFTDNFDAELKAGKLTGDYTAEFLADKYSIAASQANFRDMYIIGVRDMAVSYINGLTSSDVRKNLNNSYFKKIIQSTLDYNGRTDIRLQIEAKDAKVICNKLVKIVSEPEHFIHMVADTSQVIDFLVEHMPREMFLSYSISHGLTGIKAEQVLRAYLNTDLLAQRQLNSNYRDLIQTMELPEYLALLEKSKEYPKFYTLLAKHDIVQHFSGRKSHEFFLEHFDIDLLLTGARELVGEWGKSDYNYNTGLASSAILSLSYNSYDEDMGVKLSYMTASDSDKILDFFIENPLMLANINTVGIYTKLQMHLNENIGQYKIDLDKFLYPNQLITTEYTESSYLHSYATSLLIHYIKSGELDKANYINYVIQQDRFLDNLSYTVPVQKSVINKIETTPELLQSIEVLDLGFFIEAPKVAKKYKI